MKFLSALFGCVFVSMLAVIGPANSGTVTVEITGNGTGALGAGIFADVPFDLFLVGPDGNANVINLTSATATINGGSANTFSNPMHIGLHFGPDYAFFGYQAGGADLLQLIFSPSDFTLLQNSNSFSAAPTGFNNAFTNVLTSGGLLSFTGFSGLNLSFTSTGDETSLNATPLPAALPLFAGGLGVIGLLARRRKRKAAAVAA